MERRWLQGHNIKATIEQCRTHVGKALVMGVTMDGARVYMTQAPNAGGVWHGVMEVGPA